MAIAAWSAKILTSSIWAAVKGLTSRRPQPMTPIGVPSRRIGTPRNERYFATDWSSSSVRVS
jgi:hypothetical protein